MGIRVNRYWFSSLKIREGNIQNHIARLGLGNNVFKKIFAIQHDTKFPKSCLKGNNLNHLCSLDHGELIMSILKKVFQKHLVMILRVAELDEGNGLCSSINRCQCRLALKIPKKKPKEGNCDILSLLK